MTNGLVKRIKPSSRCLSEVMTIMVTFHLSRYRTFKADYLKHLCPHLRAAFPGLVSYTRFVEFMRGAGAPLLVFLRRGRLRPSHGVAFVDSPALQGCHNRRIHSHQTFRGIAQRGNRRQPVFFREDDYREYRRLVPLVPGTFSSPAPRRGRNLSGSRARGGGGTRR